MALSLGKKIFFIFSASSDSVRYLLPECGEGSLIFFTVDSDGNAAALSDMCGTSGVGCHPYINADKSLASIAPAVVACADKFGGIDVLLFDAQLKGSTELFLDISEDEFVSRTGLINEFHSLCRCALPYMLGREGASVRARVGHGLPGAATAAYNGAIIAMAETMNEEFGDYGIKAETVDF